MEIIEHTLTKNSVKNMMSETMKNRLRIQKALNSEFISQLRENIFLYKDITAQNIIDIVYGQDLKENPGNIIYISTERIAKEVGINLIRTKEEDSENAGSIFIDNTSNKLTIQYCESSIKHQKRFIRAHELGHLFVHLINGIKMKFADKKTKSKYLLLRRKLSILYDAQDIISGKYNNNGVVDNVLEKISKDILRMEDKVAKRQQQNIPLATFMPDGQYTPEQMKYEREADKFANELLLSDKNLDILFESGKDISANSILERFNIESTVLYARLKDKGIIYDNDDNKYNVKVINDISI